VTTEIEEARRARKILEKTCERLLRPGTKALDSSATDLTMAVECLERLEQAWKSRGRQTEGRQELAAEMERVRREIRKASALLEAANKFYAGWARLIAFGSDEAQTNYTAAGKPSEVVAIDRSRMVLHG
jgi:ferric-dicitrate binding protein FerR (iron transport regulator)